MTANGMRQIAVTTAEAAMSNARFMNLYVRLGLPVSSDVFAGVSATTVTLLSASKRSAPYQARSMSPL